MNENEEENKPTPISLPPNFQRVSSRIIPGALSQQNKDSLDW